MEEDDDVQHNLNRIVNFYDLFLVEIITYMYIHVGKSKSIFICYV